MLTRAAQMAMRGTLGAAKRAVPHLIVHKLTYANIQTTFNPPLYKISL